MVQRRLYRQKKREGSIFIKPSINCCFSVFYFVPRTGFEPMTYCLEGSCSIQLSYRGILIFLRCKDRIQIPKNKSLISNKSQSSNPIAIGFKTQIKLKKQIAKFEILNFEP
jgi:hypothetical protein